MVIRDHGGGLAGGGASRQLAGTAGGWGENDTVTTPAGTLCADRESDAMREV